MPKSTGNQAINEKMLSRLDISITYGTSRRVKINTAAIEVATGWETIKVKMPHMNINLDRQALIPSSYVRLITQYVFFYLSTHGSNCEGLVSIEREGPRARCITWAKIVNEAQ
ncbi:hypothetical protein Tco_1341151 [Tanacetum coccineum]